MYEVRVTSNGDAGATSGVTTTLLAMPPACTPFTSAGERQEGAVSVCVCWMDRAGM